MKEHLKNHLILILVFVFSMLIFIVTAINIVLNGRLLAYDKAMVSFFNSMASSYPTYPAFFITNLASVPFITMLILILIFGLFLKKRYNDIFLILFSVFGGNILNFTAKFLFERARPLVKSPVDHEIGYSFPSNHSMLSVLFYGILIYLIFRYFKNKWVKTALIILLVLIILAVGTSRIYLGVHYPSDVMGGYSLGIARICICIMIYKNQCMNKAM
jgi:undecaprenyl-diphosphatase